MGNFSGGIAEIQTPAVVHTGSSYATSRGAEFLPISVWIMDPRRVESERTRALLAEVGKAAQHRNRSILSVTYANDVTEGSAAVPTLPLQNSYDTHQRSLVIALLYERQWQAALALLRVSSLLSENALQTPVAHFVPILVQSDSAIPAQAAANLAAALRAFPNAISLHETEIRAEHGGLIQIDVDVATALEEIFGQVA